jgi:hypothetical protein
VNQQEVAFGEGVLCAAGRAQEQRKDHKHGLQAEHSRVIALEVVTR